MKPVISFQMPSTGSPAPSRELLATIWPVVRDARGPALDEAVVQSKPIRVGAEVPAPDSALELPHGGTYLVDVAFPTGQHTRRTIVLGDEQRYVFILVDKNFPGHGAEPHEQTSDHPRVVAAAANVLASWIGIQRDELIVRRIREQPPITSRARASLWTKVQQLRKMRGEIVERIATASDSQYTTSLNYQSDVPGACYLRSWLLITSAQGDDTLVAYPAEWSSSPLGPRFALTLYRTSTQRTGNDGRWKAHLDLGDPVYGSVIEYLARRDVQSSAAILGGVRAHASKMLYEKMDNPFAAAAGAYVLALGGDTDPDHEAWTRNLDERFPWLPDAAIAMGWKHLRRGVRGSADWQSARVSFEKALAVGLPYYTVGVRLLLDGLTLLRMAEPDERLSRSLAEVTALDIACSRNEPFTTVQLWRYREQSA